MCLSLFLLCRVFIEFLIKGLYPHNFERTLKSMTCVQIGSIHTDGFKNVKKIQNGTPLPW